MSSVLEEALLERGLEIPTVLRRAGLVPTFFDQEKVYASTAQLFALWKSIGDVSGDEGIGLKLGSETRFERFDPAQIAAACSENFGDALKRIAYYKSLTCPEEISIQRQGEWTKVEFLFLHDVLAEPEVLVDVCLSWTLSIAQRGSGGRIKPARLELMRDANCEALLQRHFDCPVFFKSARNAIVFRSADLDVPFETHNEALVKALDQNLSQELRAHSEGPGVCDQVVQTLRKSIAGRRPNRDEVAQRMHLSLRTLQRRLREAGVTFQQLVQMTRADLARQYLQDRTLELSEIAFLIGYEDPNSFIRDFQAWEGLTPGAWRQSQSVN
ncbi:MAG: AraC family transcriptional regulator ligand-binding domain-containing protein [Verrucomicrobiales bacterium]